MIKKIYFMLAIVTLVTTKTTFATTYTSELQSAYTYAHNLNITTQSTIDAADMFGSLLRSHMAKMMVNYAEGVLGKDPDPAKECSFNDMSDQSQEMKAYVIEACQLGLMGVGITDFNPNGVVTRAQFGTVISRALYDDAYNDGDPYYANHLQALKNAGIMNNISTPNSSEVRGYVMLMMMRAEENAGATQPSQCDTPENQLVCLVNSPDCPLECQSTSEITTFAGTLKITSVSSDVGSLLPGVKYIGSLEFTAVDQDIIIKRMLFQKIGSFTQGRIEEDGVKISILQSILSDLTTTAIFPSDLTIKSGTSKTLDIFIQSDNGGVSISNNQGITSSASSIDGSFPYRLVK